MKKLQAGIQSIQTNGIQLSQHSGLKKKALKPVAISSPPKVVSDQQSSLLSFPFRSPQAVLQQRANQGWRRLERQAQRINQLANELEAAVLELKAIASEVNPDWRAIQATQKSSTSVDVCEYHAAVVPKVEPKQDGSFVLRSRAVDLFQAEREAMLLAQTLRHRARKKRGFRGSR